MKAWTTSYCARPNETARVLVTVTVTTQPRLMFDVEINGVAYVDEVRTLHDLSVGLGYRLPKRIATRIVNKVREGLIAQTASGLPVYAEDRGWFGGDQNTVYAFTDRRTGSVLIRPLFHALGIGPEADVRIATYDEATKEGYRVESGWKVAS